LQLRALLLSDFTLVSHFSARCTLGGAAATISGDNGIAKRRSFCKQTGAQILILEKNQLEPILERQCFA
jgi:hypothetical protein